MSIALRALCARLLLLILSSCAGLGACSATSAAGSSRAKPGCDRNGDYEQRIAC